MPLPLLTLSCISSFFSKENFGMAIISVVYLAHTWRIALRLLNLHVHAMQIA
jgi:hypothetical protein